MVFRLCLSCFGASVFRRRICLSRIGASVPWLRVCLAHIESHALPLQPGIVMFSVIYLRESNGAGPSLPAVVRYKHFLPAVLIPDCQLHQKRRPGAVIVPPQQESHLPFVPACPQHGLQRIFSLFQKRCHVIGLVAQMLMV